MSLWLWALASSLLVSTIALAGALTLALGSETLRKVLLYLVSFSAGGLFGDAFIHLAPEAYANPDTAGASLLIISGIVVSIMIERFLHWRHCHVPTSNKHPHPLGYMNLFGDTVHNFIDGLLIGGSYLESIPLGLTTSLAVALHEVPQEIGDFGVLVYGGFDKTRALLMNLLTAFTAILGTIVALALGLSSLDYARFLIPFAAGNFIYIAGSDLLPELRREDQLGLLRAGLQLMAFILGVLIMYSLTFIE